MDYGINVPKIPAERDDLHPESSHSGTTGCYTGWVIPFGDGPNPIYQRNVGKSVIQNMLYGAGESVYMTSPYLIIGNDLCQDNGRILYSLLHETNFTVKFFPLLHANFVIPHLVISVFYRQRFRHPSRFHRIHRLKGNFRRQ